MTIEEQIALLEAENAKLRDDQIARLQRQIYVLQFQLDALLESKVNEIEAVNRELRAMMAGRKRKPSPLKGRRILEDYECAVSTFIKRNGGMIIPKSLRSDFGGWCRLHVNKGFTVDDMAEMAHEHGLIPEPSINALMDGLQSGRRSAREPSTKDYYAWAEDEVKRQEAENAEVPF